MVELDKYEGALFRMHRARLREQALRRQAELPALKSAQMTWPPNPVAAGSARDEGSSSEPSR